MFEILANENHFAHRTNGSEIILRRDDLWSSWRQPAGINSGINSFLWKVSIVRVAVILMSILVSIPPSVLRKKWVLWGMRSKYFFFRNNSTARCDIVDIIHKSDQIFLKKYQFLIGEKKITKVFINFEGIKTYLPQLRSISSNWLEHILAVSFYCTNSAYEKSIIK